MRYIKLAVLAATTVTAPAFAGSFHADVHGGWDRITVLGAHDDGVAYGIAAGYDFDLGDKAFVGIEGSVDDSSTKECATDVLAIGDRACLSASRDLSAVARLGYKLTDSYKLYVLAGYANGRLKASYDDGTTTTSAGANGDGLRLGTGLQMGFGTNLFGKLEYRYTNYESDFSRHQVLAGFGIEF